MCFYVGLYTYRTGCSLALCSCCSRRIQVARIDCVHYDCLLQVSCVMLHCHMVYTCAYV